MPVVSIPELKAYFNNADVPAEPQYIDLIDTLYASGGAPVDAQYVTLAVHAGLTNEQVLTGTSDQIVVTPGGPGGNVVLSTPQDIATTSAVTFDELSLGIADTVLGQATIHASAVLGGILYFDVPDNYNAIYDRGWLETDQDDFRLGYNNTNDVWTITAPSGDLTSIGDAIFQGGVLTLGVDDTTAGHAILYGANVSQGGYVDFYISANYDGTNQYWRAEVYNNYFRIASNVTDLGFQINELTGDITFDGDGKFNGGLLYVGVADDTRGVITLHGHGAAVGTGGEAVFYSAADYDATYDYWRAVNYLGSMSFSPEGVSIGTPTLTLRGEGRIGVNTLTSQVDGTIHLRSDDGDALACAKMEQFDVDEEFIYFRGYAAASTLTNSFVDEGDVTTATRVGWRPSPRGSRCDRCPRWEWSTCCRTSARRRGSSAIGRRCHSSRSRRVARTR